MSNESSFEIVCGDALEELEKLDDGSVQLVVSSPPYNIGKEYERDGFESLERYSKWMADLAEVACRKLSNTGSLCWQIGNHVKFGSILPLDFVFFPIFNELGLKLRNRIIWTFNFGLHARQRLSGRYEVMLWFTKTDEYIFNLDAVRVPQIYPGKRHANGKKRSGPSGNPLGKNPSDFWTFDGNRFFREEAVWAIPNIKWNHAEHAPHPCQFPAELVERCILAFSNEGDLVIDPFAGTGTTPIVAHALGRRGLGFELQPDYVELARQRFEGFESGVLRKRPSGMEVRAPNASEKVARMPNEWMQAAE